ncbi:glycoside hydrolase domain-containing protein [uncultured Microbacterium sp.]|uniref:glycoside hydrolase domain-containing protein n=1 Tax=uncultured Microbacterium sp. TaxID=191216 RepID=UPI0025F293EA|nr:glycoside hydrolase domain-containing protein [uncultured Microbacterium sp.]
MIFLQPADGPADPPSSRPHTGVLGGQVHRFAFRPADGEQRLCAPGLDALRCTPDTVLHWAFYADGDAAVSAPWAPLAVTVDARAGEERLSDDTRVRDRYGFRLDADSQFAAAWSMPEQWNADTVSLAPFAGRTAEVEIVLGTSALATDAGTPDEVTGFVELRVEELSASTPSPAERVDTRRGSHAGDRFSRGNTVPAVAVPHGFTFLTPATDARDQRWPYRPFVHDDERGRRLEAVQFSHQPSPWIGDRGVLQVMPFDGTPVSAPTARRRWIAPGSERAHPHVWSAMLDGGLRIETTATDHVGLFRVEGDDSDAEVGFIIDQPGAHGTVIAQGDSVRGWVGEADPWWGNGPRTFFAGVMRGDAARSGRLDDDGRGERTGFVAGTGALELRIAISFISLEQAQRALALEAPEEMTFDEIRDRSRGAWDAVLDSVQIPQLTASERPFRGLADTDIRAQLASALYRLHLYPNAAEENVGSAESPRWAYADPFTPAGEHTDTRTGAPIAAGRLPVNNGYWDTYRTAWPMMSLVDPVRSRELLDGMLEPQRRHGWMPRWTAPGYVDAMVGTSSDQILADGERWGLLDDPRTALSSGWRNAAERAPDARRGRKGIERGRFLGFIPRAIHEGMSWSIENAVSDAALARLADRLSAASAGDDAARAEALSRWLGNRALAYRQLFDPVVGFFRGRDADGRTAGGRFDPRVWGGDYVETNAWGMSVSAVHDRAGLAALYDGRQGLRIHLDRLFAEPETADAAFAGAYRQVIHEQREARALRSGMCAISNQPAHHIPYMYTGTDQPWLAGATAHRLARRLFAGGHIGQGFPGDEDNGEMSAWWLWAAIGLYPLELGSGELVIGSPLLDDVTVARSDGSRLRIRSQRPHADAHVLRAARVNGAPLTRAVLEVDALGADVDLELEFGDDPAESLGADEPTPVRPWHPDLTGGSGRIVHAPGVRHARRLVDDGAAGGDRGVRLRPGAWVGWLFPEITSVTDATLTAVDAVGDDALEWEWSADGTSWHAAEVTAPTALAADRTTPFRFTDALAARAVRVRAAREVRVRQIELFDLDADH